MVKFHLQADCHSEHFPYGRTPGPVPHYPFRHFCHEQACRNRHIGWAKPSSVSFKWNDCQFMLTPLSCCGIRLAMNYKFECSPMHLHRTDRGQCCQTRHRHSHQAQPLEADYHRHQGGRQQALERQYPLRGL